MDQNAWLAPLGLQRFRVLDCLGGTQPRSPAYLAHAHGMDPLLAFRTHIEALSRRWADLPDGRTMRLLAAARLLLGDLSSADVIVDGLPTAAYESDHGRGYCNVAHLHALNAALPWPTDLRDTRIWLAGSRAQTGLRAWLGLHRGRLQWLEADGVYVLDAYPTACTAPLARTG